MKNQILKENSKEVSKISMFYSELYPYNDGLFNSIEEFRKELSTQKIDLPKSIYGTLEESGALNASEIINDYLDVLNPAVINELINSAAPSELQALLDSWLTKNNLDKSYFIPDYTTVIELSNN